MSEEKKHEGGFNLIEAALLTAPIAIGAHVALKNSEKDLISAGLTESSAFEDVTQKARDIANEIADPKILERNHIEHLGKMDKKLFDKLGVEGRNKFAGHVKNAWALTNEFAESKFKNTFMQFTETLGDLEGHEAFKAVAEEMTRRKSKVFASEYSKFYSHLRTMMKEDEPIKNLFAEMASPDLVRRDVALSELPRDMRQALNKLTKTLESGDATVTQITKKGYEDYGTYQIRAGKGETRFTMKVPIEHKGLFYKGDTLASQYISREQVHVEVGSKAMQYKKMSMGASAIEEVNSTVGNMIQSGSIVTDIEASERAQGLIDLRFGEAESVANVQYDKMPKAYQQNIATKSRSVQLLKSVEEVPHTGDTIRAVEELDSTERRDFLLKHENFFPGTNPEHYSRSIVQTVNTSKKQLFNELVNTAKRPDQMIRPRGLTEESASRLKKAPFSKYSVSEKAIHSTPSMPFLFVDDSAISDYTKMVADDGEILVNSVMMKNIVQEDISSVRFGKLHSEFYENLEAVKAGKKPTTQIMGWDREGNVVEFDSKKKYGDMTVHEDLDGTFTSLQYNQETELAHGSKIHGNLKATLVEEPKAFGTLVQRTPFQKKEIFGIAPISALKKDMNALATQEYTAFTYLMEKKQEAAAKAAGEKFVPITQQEIQQGARDLYDQAETALKIAKEEAGAEGKTTINEMATMITGNLMDKAVEAKFTPQEFATTFFPASRVVGVENMINGLAMSREVHPESADLIEQYIKEIQKNSSQLTGFGIHPISFGKEMIENGVGNRAGIDARVYEFLTKNTHGGLGEDLAREILARQVADNPHAYAAHVSGLKSMESTVKKMKIPEGDTVLKFGAENSRVTREELRRATAKGDVWLDVGKGQNPIFVPSDYSSRAMRTREIGTMTASTDYRKSYDRLLDEMNKVHSVTEYDMKKYSAAVENFNQTMWKQIAPGGKGVGGFSRGKLAASITLQPQTSVNGINSADVLEGNMATGKLEPRSTARNKASIPETREKAIKALEGGKGKKTKKLKLPIDKDISKYTEMPEIRNHPFTVGMTDESFHKLLNESRGFLSNEDIKWYKKAWYNGEGITMGRFRNPTIGPFSFNFATAKRIKGRGLNLVTPKVEMNVGIQAAEGAAPEIMKVDVGAMLGMAMDKDGDTVGMMLFDRKMHKKATEAMLSKQYSADYINHAVLTQVNKSRIAQASKASTLGIRESAIAGSMQSAQIQESLPGLSLEFSKAKRALRMSDNPIHEGMATFLEGLEQNIISSKHHNPESFFHEEFKKSIMMVSDAMKNSDTPLFNQALEGIYKVDPTIIDTLTEGLTLTEESAQDIGKVFGHVPSRKIAGFDIAHNVPKMMGAIRSYNTSNAGRIAELFANRGPAIRNKELNAVIETALGKTKNGIGKKIATKATTEINRFMAIGDSGIKGYKPLALGFAASLAIASVLSKPKKTLGDPGERVPYKFPESHSPDRVSQMMESSHSDIHVSNPIAMAPALIRSAGSAVSSAVGATMAVGQSGIGAAEAALNANPSFSGNVILQDDRRNINPYAFGNKVL